MDRDLARLPCELAPQQEGTAPPAGRGVRTVMTDLTKGERTKRKLVEATASLLRRQGYHATGLSAIVDESGAPRGSLYFYFPNGKDELAVAAIDASGVEWRDRIEAAVAGAPDLGTAIGA